MHSRLDDRLAEWQAHIRSDIHQIVDSVLKQIEATDHRPISELAPERVRTARDQFCERAIPVCLTWMESEGCLPKMPTGRVQIEGEIQSAILQLPVTPLGNESGDAVVVPPTAMAIPAAVGAALGALALSSLTALTLDNRYVGLLVGSVVGAYLLVRLLAFLAARPELQTVLKIGAASTTIGMASTAVWEAIGGRNSGWLRRSLFPFAIYLLLMSARPERVTSTHAQKIASVRVVVLQQLQFDASMILALLWAHPDRFPDAAQLNGSPANVLPRGCWSAIAELGDVFLMEQDEGALRDGLKELFQRLQDHGYEVQEIPRGASFEDAMKEAFEIIGFVQPGNPVRTYRPALRYRGEVIHKGELRRCLP
jgi:hypothetical protein